MNRTLFVSFAMNYTFYQDEGFREVEELKCLVACYLKF